MKRVLITGATGFVGRQVIKALNDSQTLIIPVVRTGKENEFKNNTQVERIVSTVDMFAESESWWFEECKNIDIIIHCAWYAEPGKYLQSTLNTQCLTGSLNLVAGATKAGVKRFVGIGTCFEYDLNFGIIRIDTPLKPESLYAATKTSLFLVLSNLLPAKSVEFVWCRLFYLYGEGEDERRLVPYIRKQLQSDLPANLTSGKQIRDFLDVSVAGSRIARIAMGNTTGAVNICSGIPVTVKQFAEEISKDIGNSHLLVFGNRPDNVIDPPCVVGIPNFE